MKVQIPNLTPLRRLGRPGEAAFTMVEVAMSLAIVAFALVAIMGVMPTGLNVQRQNREETVIAQDASYLMEAIKSGENGRFLDIIAANLRSVHRTNVYNGQLYTNFWDSQLTGGIPRPEAGEVLGYLCRPYTYLTPDNFNMTNNTRLRFRAFSGNMSSLVPHFTDVFEYEVETQVELVQGRQGPRTFAESFVGANLYSVKLTFRWPVLPTGELGTGEKEFVTQVSGYLNTKEYNTNNNNYTDINIMLAADWRATILNIANIGVNPNIGFIFEDELIGPTETER